MSDKLTRRTVFQVAGAAALAAPAGSIAAPAEKLPMGMKGEGPDTPKICLEYGSGGLSAGGNTDDERIRRIKQLGVNYAVGAMGAAPWDETRLRAYMDKAKEGGLTIGNIMIGFPYSCYSSGGKGKRAARAASERSPRPGQPRLATDHGLGRGMEEAGGYRAEQVERDYIRLWRDPRDGARSCRSLPLFRRERPDQPCAFPECDCRETLR